MLKGDNLFTLKFFKLRHISEDLLNLFASGLFDEPSIKNSNYTIKTIGRVTSMRNTTSMMIFLKELNDSKHKALRDAEVLNNPPAQLAKDGFRISFAEQKVCLRES